MSVTLPKLKFAFERIPICELMNTVPMHLVTEPFTLVLATPARMGEGSVALPLVVYPLTFEGVSIGVSHYTVAVLFFLDHMTGVLIAVVV